MKPNSLLFGTAGIPLSTPNRNILNGISHLTTLDLDGMEIEFVRSVNIKEEKAKEVNIQRKKYGKLLTCHAPYYINLNSLEKEKIVASKNRILNAAHIANICGAWSVTFHAAFYQKIEKETVYNNVKKEMKSIVKQAQDTSNPIWIRPETTGKESQFGNIDELLKLAEDIEQVLPCIDFSHIYTRSIGKINKKEDFTNILEKVENVLGKEGLSNIHAHMSGIEYTEKGERRHLEMKDSDFNYKAVLEVLKDFNTKGIVISESPNIEQDAITMKQYYSKLSS